MQVCELDRPWLETPFALQGFTVHSAADIAMVAHYCQFVEVAADALGHPLVEQTQARPVAQRTPSPASVAQREALERQEQARALTRSMLDDVRLGRAVDMKAVRSTVSECVSGVIKDPDTMLWVARIRERDNYTAEHCLNVGLLAISFGHYLGAGEDELLQLGVAGILHDVGKMRTPLEILNKEGALTAAEMAVMQRHARHGRDILITQSDVPRAAVDVAFSHHEALDGSGYPRGLRRESITSLTRMITLCDVFDAITSDRIYKAGQPAVDALRILFRLRGTKFDERLTDHFIRFIGVYPPGTLVELCTGEVGIVISVNRNARQQPRVLVVCDREGQPLPERVVNLEQLAREHANTQPIVAALPNGTHGIRLEEYIRAGLTLA
jgi:putative nucleotidyltransferase with HDIG domain